MILELADKRAEILRTPLQKFDFQNPPCDPRILYTDLAETMNKHNGLGLSANQVGIPYRVFVMRASPVIGCFNPVVVDQSTETWVDEEGCLSFPGIVVKVRRPVKIKVRFADALGETSTHVFAGLTARIFLHELDHINGRLFTESATNLELALAIKRAKKKSNATYVIGDLR